MPPLRLFISHAHRDKPLADALKRLISAVFPTGSSQLVKVDYSSDDSPDGGPEAGTHWLEWIFEVVRNTDVCVVILTADSVTAPWLMWEAGAVSGVAVSSFGPENHRVKIVPLLFGVGPDSIPAPLKHRQAIDGQQDNKVTGLLMGLHHDSRSAEPFPTKVAARAVSRFLRTVEDAIERRSLARPLQFRPAAEMPVRFVSCSFGLTLQPDLGQIRNSVRLAAAPFDGESYQGWFLHPVRNGVYKVLSFDRSHCVSVDGDRVDANAPLMLWKYVGHETQHWKLDVYSGTFHTPGTVRIVNSASGLCLAAWPTAQDIVQLDIHNFSNEDWWIVVAPEVQSS